MSKFEFPQNPGTQRENPFEDERGANPFSDGQPDAEDPITANAFAAPAATDDERPYVPGDYQAVQVTSVKSARRLAILGIVLAGLGVLVAGIAITATGSWITPLFFVLPLEFAALAAALPACIIARRDLRAIKAGAMDQESLGKLRFAFWLALGGVLTSILPVVLYFAMLVAGFLASL